MLRVTVLGSGSRGNSILIEGRDTTVLVDAGFLPRTFSRRLLQTARRAEEIDALLLTHEHVDHAQGALPCCAKWGWSLHGTAGTLRALPDSLTPTVCIPIQSEVAIGSLSVMAVRVPHDANEAAAFVITERASGYRVGIAMDLGHVPAPLHAMFEKLDWLVIESNHDEAMLSNGPYPWSLKRRISSEVGHLSNGQTATFVAQCAHAGLRGVVLAHLSETNNTPALAIQRTTEALRKMGWRRDAVWAANQGEVRGPYETSTDAPSTAGPMRAVQLGLALQRDY